MTACLNSSLEQAFASIGSDLNKDGKISIKINSYISGNKVQDSESAYYQAASEVALIGDISDCDSYFFLMEKPEEVQLNYHILASADGSAPAETDYSIKDKVVLWKNIPELCQLDLSSSVETVSGKKTTIDNQKLFSGLSLGRRYFYQDQTIQYKEECEKLWDSLIK